MDKPEINFNCEGKGGGLSDIIQLDEKGDSTIIRL